MGWLGLGGAIQKGFIAEVALEVDLWGRTGCAPGGYAGVGYTFQSCAQDGVELGFHRDAHHAVLEPVCVM